MKPSYLLRLFLLLCIPVGFAEECTPSMLRDVGKMMAVYMCHVYNDSHLDKLNGFLLSPNATITLQDFDFRSGRCGDFYSMPMNEYFVHVFKVEHHCFAAIPVWSHIGENSIISITGYGDLVAATQSKIKEITFYYSQPSNDCTLQLTSMIMLDVQCAGMIPPATPEPTPTSTSISRSSLTANSSSSKTQVNPTITNAPFVDIDKYTSTANRYIPGIDDSYNNPIFHQTEMPICSAKHPRFKLVMSSTSYKYAALSCLRKGLRMATIRREELGEAINMVSECLGPEQSVWIGTYWGRPQRRNNECLELISGSKPNQGSINKASNCNKQQAVLCEDPYLSLY